MFVNGCYGNSYNNTSRIYVWMNQPARLMRITIEEQTHSVGNFFPIYYSIIFFFCAKLTMYRTQVHDVLICVYARMFETEWYKMFFFYHFKRGCCCIAELNASLWLSFPYWVYSACVYIVQCQCVQSKKRKIVSFFPFLYMFMFMLVVFSFYISTLVHAGLLSLG